MFWRFNHIISLDKIHEIEMHKFVLVSVRQIKCTSSIRLYISKRERRFHYLIEFVSFRLPYYVPTNRNDNLIVWCYKFTIDPRKRQRNIGTVYYTRVEQIFIVTRSVRFIRTYTYVLHIAHYVQIRYWVVFKNII